MYVSGIRPVSDFYTDMPAPVTKVEGQVAERGADRGSFGSYDVSRLRRSAPDHISTGKVNSLNSLSQAHKAVDVMKKDAVLHRYQKFVGDRINPANLRPEMENFTL